METIRWRTPFALLRAGRNRPANFDIAVSISMRSIVRDARNHRREFTLEHRTHSRRLEILRRAADRERGISLGFSRTNLEARTSHYLPSRNLSSS